MCVEESRRNKVKNVCIPVSRKLGCEIFSRFVYDSKIFVERKKGFIVRGDHKEVIPRTKQFILGTI